MKKRHSIVSFALGIALLGGSLIIAPSVQAASCAGVETSVIDCSSDGDAALMDIVRQAIGMITGAVFALAIAAVIYGAVLYSSAGGGGSSDKPGSVQKAKSIWTNTVIGLALYAFLVAITNFLIPGGIFG